MVKVCFFLKHVAVSIDPGFSQDVQTMGWHGRLDQADGGGASGARIKNRKQRGKRTWRIGWTSYEQSLKVMQKNSAQPHAPCCSGAGRG